MIKLANQYNSAGEKCVYVLNQSDDLSHFRDATFDFIYSCRVLQHMRPDYCLAYLREFVRLLTADGVLVFQEPAARLDDTPSLIAPVEDSTWKQNLKAITPGMIHALYWKLKGAHLQRQLERQPKMEMYCIAKEEMVTFLKSLACIVVDVQEDDSAPSYLSLRYCVTKEKRKSNNGVQ